MTITAELFPRCALPGCANPTDTQGHPCGQCRRDFGTFLRHNPDGHPMTADAQTARDHDVALAYRAQEQLRDRRRRRATPRDPGWRTGEARTDLLAVRGTPQVRPPQRAVRMPNLPHDHRLTDQPEGHSGAT
nr:hypothetical protein [Gordonia sp. LAM0048]